MSRVIFLNIWLEVLCFRKWYLSFLDLRKAFDKNISENRITSRSLSLFNCTALLLLWVALSVCEFLGACHQTLFGVYIRNIVKYRKTFKRSLFSFNLTICYLISCYSNDFLPYKFEVLNLVIFTKIIISKWMLSRQTSTNYPQVFVSKETKQA